MPHGIIRIQSICDVSVSLNRNSISIQIDGPEPGVDLQGLGQQPCPHVTHQVPGNVQSLKTLIGPQGVNHIVDLRFQFAV